MKETGVQQEIQLDMSANGHRAFRNNNGVLRDREGTYIAYGMGNGTSDLIGFTSIKITPEMVGKRVAIFTAMEVKKDEAAKLRDDKNKKKVQQGKFISFVKKMGGIAGFVWTVQMSRDLINKIDLPDY